MVFFNNIIFSFKSVSFSKNSQTKIASKVFKFFHFVFHCQDFYQDLFSVEIYCSYLLITRLLKKNTKKKKIIEKKLKENMNYVEIFCA